jgi:hypothetical protein
MRACVRAWSLLLWLDLAFENGRLVESASAIAVALVLPVMGPTVLGASV